MKDRRRFLQDMGRATIAGGLTAVTAFLLSRGQRSGGTVDRREHACSNHWICISCSRLAGCPLPQALSARAQGVQYSGGSKGAGRM